MTSLSIIMPVYNESATIRNAVEQVLAVDFPCQTELIVVNDGSTDGTAELLADYPNHGVTVVHHTANAGKGAAVSTGLKRARGSHAIIFDADLEYSPSDIPAMMAPVLNGQSNYVFGTRVFGLNTRFPSLRFAAGGRATTVVANILYDSCVTDIHTCLKLVPREDLLALSLSERGFGLDTQVTARMLRAGIRPFEVPISYNGRTVEAGKKISWRDGVKCVSILLDTRRRPARALPVGDSMAPVAVASITPIDDSLRAAI